MEQYLESIWSKGFLNEEKDLLPKINDFYNRRSKLLTNKILRKFQIEVWSLIPMAIALFLFTIILDNDYSVFWGLISALPCLFWFYIGIKQSSSLKNINYGTSCYDYLLSMRQKLMDIASFNKKLTITGLPVILFPMLLYTYFNNQDKNIGEIFGIASLNWSNLTLFLLLPVIIVVALILGKIGFDWTNNLYIQKFDSLIKEMEELRN